jgi:hypothetical protein
MYGGAISGLIVAGVVANAWRTLDGSARPLGLALSVVIGSGGFLAFDLLKHRFWKFNAETSGLNPWILATIAGGGGVVAANLSGALDPMRLQAVVSLVAGLLLGFFLFVAIWRADSPGVVPDRETGGVT